MKLNLLPTTVSKGRQAQSAVFLSALIAIIGVVIGGALNVTSSQALDTAKSEQQASVGPAQEAYSKSQEADSIMNDEKSVALIRNASLAKAMIDHNDVYPALYESIKPYIPAFYRINSISASSAGGNATVILVGTLDTYQQYADLMLAFSRYPKLSSISRSGFSGKFEVVPNINQTDTEGRPRTLDTAPIPDDKFARLAYFQAQVQQEAYTGVGNFGTGTDNTRGAMPDSSLVTVTMTIPYDLQVPEPRLTLTAGAGGAAASTGAATAAGPPPGTGGPPPGAGRGPGTGAGTGATGAGSKKGGKGATDDAD